MISQFKIYDNGEHVTETKPTLLCTNTQECYF